MKKQTILFLAANPSETDPLALEREARAIQKELRGSGYRDHFEFKTQWAAEPLDLLRTLREIKPALVHFSGRGGPDGLLFHAKNGSSRLVSTDAFADAFGAAGSSVKLVVLSTCYRDTLAAALLAHVECVVGIGGAIHGDAARIFAIGFYGALGEGESVEAAYKHGIAAIKLEGLPDDSRPQLYVSERKDADRCVRVAPLLVDPAACPYPGMQPYSADAAQYFYGRGVEVGKLLGRLRAGDREIYVIGPSGSGKSSLVAAGVLPQLIRGVPGLGPFVVRSMRPSEHPIARLSEALGVPEGEAVTANAIAALLAHRGCSTSVLVVIDQLEELFTLTLAEERTKFLSALQALRMESRCVFIFSLRADFFGDFMESPLWTDRIPRIEVGPLRRNALREVIARPAQKLGVFVEPELIERLCAEAAAEPGILPLLQDILVQLWDRRRERLFALAAGRTSDNHERVDLTLADYDALSDGDRSGLAVALANRADVALSALTPAQKVIARRILLRLISFGEGRSDTRRQQPRSKLRAADDNAADFDTVLRRLVADRLLTMDDSEDPNDARVDLAHEVMTTAWPKLADWVKTRRADEQRRRHFEAAAARWEEHGRGASGLLDKREIAEVEVWRRTESARELGESTNVAALVTASKAAAQRRLVGRAAVALAMITSVAIVTIHVRQRANEADAERRRLETSHRESEHRLALSYQEAGRQLLLEGHPLKALPYLVAARKKGEEGATLRMLYWAATRYYPIGPPLQHEGVVTSAAFSPASKRLVTTSDKTARIWDISNPSTPKQLATLEHEGDVRSAGFSVDGARIVTASADKTARLWDVSTGKQLAVLEHQTSVQNKPQVSGHTQMSRRAEVRSAVFSPDGRYVVTAGDDKTARLWDARTGKPIPKLLRHQGDVQSAVFNVGGTLIVTASADQTARVWDASTGTPLSSPFKHHGVVRSAAFSPDSTQVVTVSAETAAQVWEAASGKRLATLEHQGIVSSAAFSADGTRIVTASEDRTARVWDARTGKPLTKPLEHQGVVLSAAFSPDGSRIVTASADRTARVWDAVTGGPLARPLQHQGEVRSAVFSFDGARIVTASSDQTARVWDARTGKSLEHKGEVRSAAFSPDGTRVVTGSSDHTARIWEVATGKLLTTLEGHEGTVNNAAFSPDGARIVTPSDDRTARIWEAATGKPRASPLEHRGVVWSAAFSPDGSRVVTASADKTARIWNVATGQPSSPPLEHGGVVWSAVFSPDGTRIVTASADKTAQIWDATNGKRSTRSLEHQEEVRSAAFSPDGTRVVTASWDNAARIWDAATGEPLTPPLLHQGVVRSAAFSPDNTRIVTAGDGTAARVWDAVTGRALAIFTEHHGTVWSAVFNRDGTRVVTASDDGTACIWDAATGKVLATLEHQGSLRSAAFSMAGNRVVTASNNNTAHIWETQLDQTLDEWSALAVLSPFVLSDDGVLRLQVIQAFGTGDSRRDSPIEGPYPSLDR